ncbi:DsbA family protein [Sinorhizobium numidicum]|uniref:DsbA family protein n=1 Tax=Sinorhizobium numidicum TaxID=680248 RepID=UPI003CC8C8DE
MDTIEFWYELTSSCSYLAAMRADETGAARGRKLESRPFLLGPMFAARGLSTSPFNVYPLKGAYMWRDIERIAATRNLPLRRPEAFP